MTFRSPAVLVLLTGLAAGCGGSGGAAGSASSNFVEGKDYLVLERVRLLDSMGFDKPVEAMSILAPRGWKTEGGVTWRGINDCRGEMVTSAFKVVSPDGAIRFEAQPARTFIFYQNAMLQQSAIQAQSQGGCAVSQTFPASQYLAQWAKNELDGATVDNVRKDEALAALIEKLAADSNKISREFGTGMQNTGTAAFANLTWPDGSKGLANVGVMIAGKQSRDQFTGQPNGFASTTVFHRIYIRYPADREAEAVKIFGTITSSHRINPSWQQAKDNFMTQLGNIEHKGRMDRIRIMGEQAAAFAKNASEASDARMRSWEQQNAASDRQQHRFIQTIREVETWKDSSGNPVELSAGYHHGWSRPDGSYILTNNSLFDPAVVFKENWTRMEKPVK